MIWFLTNSQISKYKFTWGNFKEVNLYRYIMNKLVIIWIITRLKRYFKCREIMNIFQMRETRRKRGATGCGTTWTKVRSMCCPEFTAANRGEFGYGDNRSVLKIICPSQSANRVHVYRFRRTYSIVRNVFKLYIIAVKVKIGYYIFSRIKIQSILCKQSIAGQNLSTIWKF